MQPRLYRLALEKGTAGPRFHAVDEEGVPLHDIAEAIGRRLNMPVVSKTPEEAAEILGFLALPVSMDNPTSSKRTQEQLGWRPTQPGLIPTMEAYYFN